MHTQHIICLGRQNSSPYSSVFEGHLSSSGYSCDGMQTRVCTGLTAETRWRVLFLAYAWLKIIIAGAVQLLAKCVQMCGVQHLFSKVDILSEVLKD